MTIFIRHQMVKII